MIPDNKEIAYFDGLAHEWWSPGGDFAALRRMTPARVAYIKRSVARLPAGEGGGDLNGLSVMDIGCGGGILAEPLARLGADVTGIDASKTAIDAARHHAAITGLAIDYHNETAEAFAARTRRTFDVVIASEVIEHVQDRLSFLKSMTLFAHAKKPSIAVLTTINRSIAGVALGKYAAEYIFGLAPKGAHDPARLVKPAELLAEAREAGIAIDDITGIRPSFFSGFAPGGPPLINYAVSGIINRN